MPIYDCISNDWTQYYMYLVILLSSKFTKLCSILWDERDWSVNCHRYWIILGIENVDQLLSR